jgi:hypothetical protein
MLACSKIIYFTATERWNVKIPNMKAVFGRVNAQVKALLSTLMARLLKVSSETV